MKKYIGTKEVYAQPMSAYEANENGYKIGKCKEDAEGYEVEYKDGYKSWSPKNVFEEAYKPIETYIGQSGVFTNKKFKSIFIGGTKNIKSNIIYGIDDIVLDGIGLKGLSFVKSNKGAHRTTEIIKDTDYQDETSDSFIYIPRTKDAIKYLIESLEWLRDNIND